MERKLGIVVFSSYSGLGNQSRRLTQMLKPERILLVNNESFSKNSEQHPEWYEGFTGYTCDGFPGLGAITKFLNGLTHLYVIENPLNWHMIAMAKAKGIVTYIASNYEFCDNLIKPHLPIPDKFLMPSHWMIDDMKKRFGEDKVIYLPPPIFPEDFKIAREHNLNDRHGKPRFLHVVGTLAAADRNGTLLLLGALQRTRSDFELVIKSQHPLPEEYQIKDHRVYYKFGSDPEVENIYKDFDAMIMPRRFGGLCLPMQEALMSAVPVIMSDVSPNNQILPKEWLVPAVHNGTIQTRTSIDLYSTNAVDLAAKIDELVKRPQITIDRDRLEAFDLSHREYAQSSLIKEYEKLW